MLTSCFQNVIFLYYREHLTIYLICFVKVNACYWQPAGHSGSLSKVYLQPAGHIVFFVKYTYSSQGVELIQCVVILATRRAHCLFFVKYTYSSQGVGLIKCVVILATRRAHCIFFVKYNCSPQGISYLKRIFIDFNAAPRA